MGQQIQGCLRAGLPVFRHLAQARRPHRKQRHFRPREETVHGDE
jgi:hypothetical protein